MSTVPSAKDIEMLLDEEGRGAAQATDEKENDAHGSVNRRDRSRDRRSPRYSPRRENRNRRNRDRPNNRYRESSRDRARSRDRDHRRRDGSRPRSSKGADTDEDYNSYRPTSPRDRYHGSGRRDRGGDYYSGGGRVRSRSPRSPRHRVDEYRERHARRSRERDDRRERRRTKTPTPEVTEDDRDRRTVFVQQISQRAETRHLRQFFEAIGPVVEAQIVKDRVTLRSKGVGYVEFKDQESVPKAIELTGKTLKGVPIIVQHTEAEKNRAARPSEGGAAPGANGAPFHRLYVGNIHFSVQESDLKQIFEPFGELEQVILQRDELNPGRSKGYGFVQFVDPKNAKDALGEMNGFELAGRQIRVGLGNDKFTPESTASLLRTFNQHAQTYEGSAFSGAGGRGAHAGGSGGVFDRPQGREDRGISGASALDDSDVGGVNYKTYDRTKLMNALARRDVTDSSAQLVQPAAKARPAVVAQTSPSKCIKIEDAFDADAELKQYGPDWAEALKTEVELECNKAYGKVVHIAVDANSDGDIFVKFDSVDGGVKAFQGLNGRTFNSRTLRASYVVDKIYNSLWADAAESG